MILPSLLVVFAVYLAESAWRSGSPVARGLVVLAVVVAVAGCAHRPVPVSCGPVYVGVVQ